MPKVSAIFLDRDGVLNDLILNPTTGEYESPHALADLKISPGVLEALTLLQPHFSLFIVSNQPSFAKGKVSLEILKAIGIQMETTLKNAGVSIVQSYYCHHHPQSIVPELKVSCACRKPGNLFLQQAAASHSIDLSQSWMLGDRDSDIVCGASMECRTVLIQNPLSKNHQGKSLPTLKASGLLEAARAILGAKI